LHFKASDIAHEVEYSVTHDGPDKKVVNLVEVRTGNDYLTPNKSGNIKTKTRS